MQAGAYDLQTTQMTATREDGDEMFDTDNDMYGVQFAAGQKVDFCRNGVWYNGQVEIGLDEMVFCSASVQNANGQTVKISHWIELESDNIAPYKCMTRSDREYLHKFYVDLF